jgi:hypothetical protein
LACEPDGRRRRRRRDAPPVFSGLAAAAGGAATGGGSGRAGAGVSARPRRPRLRLPDGCACSTPTGLPATTLLFTFAPISPSAHSAPSVVWTSTRQTTIEDGAPPTGGRFWVSVQRA